MTTGKDAQQPEWTTSRCFRLLRPLVSRRATTSLTERTLMVPQQVKCETRPIRPRFGDSPNPRLDPDWMRSRKQAGRQYAKSGPSSEPVSEPLSGALSVPTPFVRRIHKSVEDASTVESSQHVQHTTGRDIFNDKFMSQADQVALRSAKLVKGALDLVEATNTCSNAASQQAFFPVSGARSLRAMCCKRYARLIVTLEQEQEKAPSETRFEVAPEAFELLVESFDAGSSDYLRAVSREYGLAILETSMLESRIMRSHAIALLRRMQRPQRSHAKHTSEAEVDSLMAILLRSRFPDKQCCNRDNTFGNLLNSIAEVSSTASFQLIQFRHLINTSMPLCWLGSRRLIAFWSNLLCAFIDDQQAFDSHVTNMRDASRFLEAFVTMDCGLRQPSQAASDIFNSTAIADFHGHSTGCPKCPRMSNAAFLNAPTSNQQHAPTNLQMSRKRLNTTLDNSTSSLFAILAALIFAAARLPDRFERRSIGRLSCLLYSLSTDVLMNLSNLREAYQYRRASSVIAAALISALAQKEDYALNAIAVNDLVVGLESIDRLARKSRGEMTLNLLPEFVISVTESTGKLLQDDGFATLTEIVSSFTAPQLDLRTSASTRALLAELSIASAELFAKRKDLEVAEAFAQEIKEKFCLKRRYNSNSTPFKATPRTLSSPEGLKWEDGIGEWIDGPSTHVEPRHRGCQDVLSLGPANTPMVQQHKHIKNLEEDSSIFESSPSFEDQHDSGIASLLLTPLSPLIDVEGAQPSSSPLKASKEARRPLSDRTNLPDSDMVDSGCQKQQARKRSRSSHSQESEDDELWSNQPKMKKKTAVRRQLVLEARETRIEDTDDELGTSSSDMSRAHNTRHLRKTERRNRRPRGLVMHELSTMGRGLQSSVVDDSDSSEDELIVFR